MNYEKNIYKRWIINFTLFCFVGYCLKCLWWISSRSFSAISARDRSRLILVSPKYLSANVIFVFFLLFFRRCDCFCHDFMASWDVSFWRYKTKSFYEDRMPFFSMYFYNDIKLEKGGKSIQVNVKIFVVVFQDILIWTNHLLLLPLFISQCSSLLRQCMVIMGSFAIMIMMMMIMCVVCVINLIVIFLPQLFVRWHVYNHAW